MRALIDQMGMYLFIVWAIALAALLYTFREDLKPLWKKLLQKLRR